MAAPRESLNKATHSVGFHAKFVTVSAITADNLWAVTTDRQFVETRVPLLVQRSKGPLPEVGDTWLIDQAMGSWTFAAFVGKSTADFAGKTVAMDVADLIYVQGTPPSSPALGDMWMNSARGNELAQWQGSGWVALQFGTAAIANGAITAAKLAPKTVTAAQISDAAGITASQVAFTVNDLGGVQMFTGTAQPTGMKPGDIWLNPAQGNAMSTWTGQVWHPLQFGAPAIAPASLTGGQIAPGAIGPAAINFTAKDIGGITTSISGAQPASPKIGDLWYDATNGYVLDQWNGTAWVPFQYGTNAIQAGSVTAALIAANTITAAQIAAGTITAAQIATGTITASLFAAVGTNDFNAYLAGGDSTGWTASGGTFSVQQPAGAPYTNVAQISANGTSAGPKILAAVGTAGMYPVQPGQQVLVSALAWTTQTTVNVGAVFYDASGTFISNSPQAQISVTASTWTYVYNIVTVPAGAFQLARFVGLIGTPASGTILQATAISALSGFDGGIITAGTVTAAQIAAGSIIAGLIDANAIDGMTITGNTINGATVNSADLLVTGGTGGLFVYENAANQTVQVWNTTAGTFNWTCPPGVTSVLVECWGAGGGGAYNNTDNGAGGGAGAYAASTITVVPGTVYTFVVGAKGSGGTSGAHTGGTGGDTTWMSTVIIAKGGTGAQQYVVGTHQTGSVGTTVHQGGDGALGYMGGSNFFGGGGGSSGGTAANGKTATNNAGATAVSGGGPGGTGGVSSSVTPGQAPTSKPGGGGGGGVTGAPNGGAGSIGQVRLTFSSATTVLSGSIAGSSGTDPVAGIAYPEGAQFDNIRETALSGGNRIAGAQVETASYTVTAASAQQASKLWNIPAGDAAVGTVYHLQAFGIGTWGSTQEAFLVDIGIDGTGVSGGSEQDPTTFNASEAFNWWFEAYIFITAIGSSGAYSYRYRLDTSSNSHTPQNGYTMLRRGGSITLDTTVAHTMEMQMWWASATGAPTATSQASIFERKGT